MTQKARFPRWRTMTKAQRYNARMEAMFADARAKGHTTFNAERDSGTEGQDRESYSDTQDRESYSAD